MDGRMSGSRRDLEGPFPKPRIDHKEEIARSWSVFQRASLDWFYAVVRLRICNVRRLSEARLGLAWRWSGFLVKFCCEMVIENSLRLFSIRGKPGDRGGVGDWLNGGKG